MLERKETSRKAGGIWIEPFPGEEHPPNHTVSMDETELSNFYQSRVHYSRSNYSRDTMNIRLFGRTGDAYMVRVSTRSSPFHKLDGYLKPPKSSTISVCAQSRSSDTLEVRWNPAVTEDVRPTYCVAVNTQENLPYRCSALARLNPVNDVQFHRPRWFRETDHLRSGRIKPSVYHCVNSTEAQINYCEFPVKAFRRLSHDMRHFVFCQTFPGQTRITLFTSAHDRADYPRYYHLSVYFAHGNDPQGNYRDLLVQTVLDACMITVDSCYHNRQAGCNLVYPDHYPPSHKGSNLQGFSLLQSSASDNQTTCSIREIEAD
ncbi:hypothetical protein FGIG_01261 [Fasciola gigantica]|uniref:Uncharacterized protein n=1 Tax=Fasciola gigantica TaxID=46835 RepID=A0A504YEC1_FASGI|nr:hypothetical protein FGIG_01261 [Fasciola gigantica]